MVKLRELKEKDAPLMLEWMCDPDIQKGLKKNLLNSKLEDALKFIIQSPIPKNIITGSNIHYAIADYNDEYLGTISLKNVDIDNKSAEYAIIVRKELHGTGVSYEATDLLLDKAFTEFGFHRVYLSVYSNNEAAIKLYERCGFKYEGEFREHFLIDGKYINWKWYSILREEYLGENDENKK